MKELKSFTSVEDLKRTQAFYGPFKPPLATRIERALGVIMAVLIGASLAIILVLELSK